MCTDVIQVLQIAYTCILLSIAMSFENVRSFTYSTGILKTLRQIIDSTQRVECTSLKDIVQMFIKLFFLFFLVGFASSYCPCVEGQGENQW